MTNNADELERFVKEVLNVIAIQDGTAEVFGRTLELPDDGAMRLIRTAATRLTESLDVGR